MKRSLIASSLLAGLAALYTPVSQAQFVPPLSQVIISGSFSSSVLFEYDISDTYGVPVVGVVCLDEKPSATCKDKRTGLLYAPNMLKGGSFAFMNSIPQHQRLALHGFIAGFEGDDYLGWGAILGFNPYYQDSPKSILGNWYIFYNNDDYGSFQFGKQMALDAYSALYQGYNRAASYFGLTPVWDYSLQANGAGTPFEYQAPGVSWQSPAWNGLSFAFSVGGSVKQHRSLQDDDWVNDLASSTGVKHGNKFSRTIPTPSTPERAIQWAAAFNGYYRGLFGLDFLRGSWMLSYGQSRPLNAPQYDTTQIRRAAHISFTNFFFRQRVNVIDLYWTQNTGLNSLGTATANALQNMGLQSNFHALLLTPNLVQPDESPFGPNVQLTKSIPYQTFTVSSTLFQFVMNSSDLAMTVGYSMLRTDGYDYPGFQIGNSPGWARGYVSQGVSEYRNRFNQVFSLPKGPLATILADPAQVDDPIKPFPKDAPLLYGRLTAQTVSLNVRYRFLSPYDEWYNSMIFKVVGEVSYTRASMKLKGTPEQLERGYPTKSFELGQSLQAFIRFGIQYNF